MFTITKEFHFSASHQLRGLPTEHPCSNLHGHNYIVTVELTDIKLNDVGFVIDYRALNPIKNWIDSEFDHKNLNDVVSFNPTAENIAKYLYQIFKGAFSQLSAVTVSETEKTKATYKPEYDS